MCHCHSLVETLFESVIQSPVQVLSLNKPVGTGYLFTSAGTLHNVKQPPLINGTELELWVFVHSLKNTIFLQLFFKGTVTAGRYFVSGKY